VILVGLITHKYSWFYTLLVMDMILDALLIFTALAYLVSAIGYALHFNQPKALWRGLSTWAVCGGWGIHSILLVLITFSAGGVPLTNQLLPSMCAWLVVVVYVYLEVSTKDRSLGALIVPIVVVLHILTVTKMLGIESIQTTVHSGGWFKLHVLAYVLAYAAFAISCVGGVMYLMLLGEIQAKHFGFFYDRLPSLEVLNQINNRAATFGFLFLTGGTIASSIWAYREFSDSSIWSEPVFLPIIITWVIYAANLVARWWAGWQGKRSAFLSIMGFALVILAFPVVGLLFSGPHGLGP
jgi:ABC-type transport system involved in cytochrome c biogenesis permease subunit